MVYSIEELTNRLKSARQKKGLSQRAFAKIAGLPQSRLSKIENGLVDLQTSSLLEIARTLDLELMLIPRQTVPAVNSLIRQSANPEVLTNSPLYKLDNKEDDDNG